MGTSSIVNTASDRSTNLYGLQNTLSPIRTGAEDAVEFLINEVKVAVTPKVLYLSQRNWDLNKPNASGKMPLFFMRYAQFHESRAGFEEQLVRQWTPRRRFKKEWPDLTKLPSQDQALAAEAIRLLDNEQRGRTLIAAIHDRIDILTI